MSDDQKLALQYRMIEVWEHAFAASANYNPKDLERAREDATKAVQSCEKAVGLK